MVLKHKTDIPPEQGYPVASDTLKILAINYDLSATVALYETHQPKQGGFSGP
jgi:hypothetical protein